MQHFIVPIIIVVLLFLLSSIKVVREYERIVVFRLGRLIGEKGPGLILVIPLIDRTIKISMRVVTMDAVSYTHLDVYKRQEQAGLEDEIHVAEADVARYERILSDPEEYGDFNRLRLLNDELTELKERLSELLRRWEQVSRSLERVAGPDR